MKAVYLIGVVAAVVLLQAAIPASAATDCSQGHAVYQEGSGNFELVLRPKTATNYNTIELVELETGARFEGTIKWNMGFAVPNIRIGYPCSSGVDTNECYYEAVVYALAVADGQPVATPNLPADDEPAANTLLLPDLSRYWHYNVRAMTKTNPGENFRLTRCLQPQ